MGDSVPRVTELSPRSLQQFVEVLVSQLIGSSTPQMGGMLRTTGLFSTSGSRKSGSTIYGVSITDESGARVLADVPSALVTAEGLEQGTPVCVTGRLQARTSNYGLEIKLIASDIRRQDGEPVELPTRDAGAMTLDQLRALRPAHRPFPQGNRLRLVLIHSAASQALVAEDCGAELARVSDSLEVLPVPVSMQDAAAIAAAIRGADGDIVMLIRGGGHAQGFDIFDDARIVRAFAECDAYRIVGLGHSVNWSLVDLVCDYSARTPAQAGAHVREQIERRLKEAADALGRVRVLEQERDRALLQSQQAAELLKRAAGVKGWPWWALLVAFVAGSILARVLGG